MSDDTDVPDEEEADDKRDLVAKAMAALPRNDNDEVDFDELVALVAEGVEIDVAAEQVRRAKKLVAGRRKPGVTAPDGQLHFASIAPYDYEPDRLILDDSDPDGAATVVENHRSKPGPKHAEARRTLKHAGDAMTQAQRRQAEAGTYSDWATEQLRAGVDWADITFGRFVQSLR